MNTAQESNNAIKYIVLSILFLFIVVIAVQNLFLNKEEQLFPYGVHGEFTEKPFFEQQNDVWQVVWKIPATNCQYAELVYFEESTNNTGGIVGSCTMNDGSQTCIVEIKTGILKPTQTYKAQVNNSFCPGSKDYFTSEVFTVNMNTLSSGSVF